MSNVDQGQNQTEVSDLSEISALNPTGKGKGGSKGGKKGGRKGGRKGGKKQNLCPNGDYPKCPGKIFL